MANNNRFSSMTNDSFPVIHSATNKQGSIYSRHLYSSSEDVVSREQTHVAYSISLFIDAFPRLCPYASICGLYGERWLWWSPSDRRRLVLRRAGGFLIGMCC